MSGISPLGRFVSAESVRILALLLLCFGLFFFRLDVRPLWNTDEGMHAATSKEMVRTGDWITPKLNGEPFFDKPAFHNWLVAISFLGLGMSELGARLPSAILGLGCVLLTYFLGRRLYGPRAAFFGAAVLATSAQFFVLSRTVMHDSSLTFFTTLAFTFFFFGYSSPTESRRWFLYSYAAFGGAVLAKGPQGVLFPSAVIVLFLLSQKRMDLLRRMSLGWGVLIGLAVAAPWYVAVGLQNPGFFRYFFVDLHFGRFVETANFHSHSAMYYLPVLALGFFPWSVFLPVAWRHSWRRRAEDAHGGTTFLLIWVGFYFVFFSIADSKVPTYIHPLFPALALLLGRLWSDASDGAASKIRRSMIWSYLPFVAIPFGLPLFLRMRSEEVTAYGLDPWALLLTMGTVLVFGVGASCLLVAKARVGTSFATMVTSIVGCIALFSILVVSAINEHRTSLEIARRMDALVPKGEKLTFYRRLRDSALFYTDRQARVIRMPEELYRFLSSEEPAYCLIKETHYRDVGLQAPILMKQGDDLLVSNRPPEAHAFFAGVAAEEGEEP